MTPPPREIDTSVPHPARMYDYMLGGKDHFEADRLAAERVLAPRPEARTTVRENRAFLGRAVRFLAAEAGIRQFLDIGTGLPTTGNVHEIAQAVTPSARVVYADNDPMVLAHARALLSSSPEGRTAYLDADLRDPAAILADPVTRDILDFSQPVGLLLVAILHFIPDSEDPAGIIATLLDPLVPGSYLVASHGSGEYDRAAESASTRAYTDAGIPMQLRDSGDFARLVFGEGLELVPPGVVVVSDWRPEIPSSPRPGLGEVNMFGGVARKKSLRFPNEPSRLPHSQGDSIRIAHSPLLCGL